MERSENNKVNASDKITLQREELDVSRGGKCDVNMKTNSYGAYDLESCHMECRDKSVALLVS